MTTKRNFKMIGIDMAHQKVFHSSMVKDEGLLKAIFMPLIFAKPEDIQTLRDKGVVAFYEYLSEAGPRSVNGYPMFTTFGTLTREDNNQVMEAYNEELERLAEVEKGG